MHKITFTKNESILLFITVLVAGFILSFNEWGTTAFDLLTGLKNLIITVLIVGFSMVLKIYIQKYFAVKKGFNAEFVAWIPGMVIGLLLVLVTNGFFFFLAVGGLSYYVLEKIRVGHDELIPGFTLLGWLSMTGILSNLALAALSKLLISANIFNQAILSKLVSVNLWLVVFSIIPIPFLHSLNIRKIRHSWKGSTDGLKLWYGSLVQYMLVLIIVALNILAILVFSPLEAIVSTIMLFAIMWIVYYLFYKQNVKENKMFRYYK